MSSIKMCAKKKEERKPNVEKQRQQFPVSEISMTSLVVFHRVPWEVRENGFTNGGLPQSPPHST